MRYSTKNKSEILLFFKTNKERCFDAEDISLSLRIAPASVYRIICELTSEGQLIKTSRDGKKSVWQYADKESCPKHMHIKCVGCGRIEHIDEKSTKKIQNIIFSSTGFSAKSTSFFEGVCPECAR